MPLIFVDVEASGPVPSLGKMTEFACVPYDAGYTQYHTFSVQVHPDLVKQTFLDWLIQFKNKRLVLVSDNPAFDFMWLADWCWQTLGFCPFGHSGRRISDFYAGLTGDFYNTQEWKKWRVPPHDHNALHDAQGNLAAFKTILNNHRLTP